MTHTFLTIASAVVSISAVEAAYFKILRIAKEKGIVDNPDARKLQKEPVPVLGGVAVFIGTVSGMLSYMAACGIIGQPAGGTMLSVLCAMTVMLYVGVMDDVTGLTPTCRLIVEILTVLCLALGTGTWIDSMHGMWGVWELPRWAGLTLTVITGVGVINAVNMIDGVNGLSSGLCIACCVMFGTVFSVIGNAEGSVMAFGMAASLLPFLMRNVFGKHSRMFIGDAGTMIMGMLLTWFTMSMMAGWNGCAMTDGLNPVALAIAILSVPLADTIRVMGMRMAKGMSPFRPDRTHLHHVLTSVGVSHSITALTEIAMDVLVVCSWVAAAALGAGTDVQLYVVMATAIVLVWGSYAFIRYHATRHTGVMHVLSHLSVSTHLGHKEWWLRLQGWLDSREEKGEQATTADRMRDRHLANRFGHVANPSRKDEDRMKISGYMKGKAEVLVDDVREHSGADRMRVYAILFEWEQDGVLRVIERDGWGAPVVVTLGE